MTSNCQQRTRIAYILAPNYSGSTLLTLLLARIPAIATVGELKASAFGDVETYRCSCGERLRECTFWKRVEAVMRAEEPAFDLGDFRTHFRTSVFPCDHLLRASVAGGPFEESRHAIIDRLSRCRRIRDEIVNRNSRMIETILEIQRSSVFVDASKEPVRLQHLMRAGRWDISVIRLTRDGRGVTNSIQRHRNSTFAEAAARWRDTVIEISRCYESIPAGARISITYEGMCADPDGTVARVAEFLRLDPRQGELEPAPRHHILGNQMRLSFASTIHADRSWEVRMDGTSLSAFERIAGRYNRELGYTE